VAKRGPVLIIGGDGLVGRSLEIHLTQAGYEVVATTRRRSEPTSSNRIFLDLEEDPTSYALPQAEVAFIAAGCSGFEMCRANQELSTKVNITNTVALASRLSAAGTFIVFLSSSAVFDGSVLSPTENAAPSPTSVYGAQKAAAEELLRQLTDRLAIVRFGKAIPHTYPRFMAWHEQLVAGKQIQVLRDLLFAPLSTSYLVEALRRIHERGHSGVFHLSPEHAISYAQVAEYMCHKYHLDPALVVAKTVQESGLSIEYVPKYATLGCADTLRRLSLPIPQVWDAVDVGLPPRSAAPKLVHEGGLR
jgi:dTDP-4-dehydrorhamnose reductase